MVSMIVMTIVTIMNIMTVMTIVTIVTILNILNIIIVMTIMNDDTWLDDHQEKPSVPTSSLHELLMARYYVQITYKYAQMRYM